MESLRLEKKEVLISLFLIAVFLLTRLINLTIIPIFTDEAIYLRWAQIGKNDAAFRFLSLSDGKQPLFVWLTMAVMKLVADPLVAGRLVSVVAGLISLVSVWLLAYALFQNKRISFLAAVLYLCLPFALVYDRLALMDGLVGTFSLLSLLLEVLLVKTLRLDVAMLLGFVLAGGILTKSSGFFNLYLFPFSLLLFDWQKKQRRQRLTTWFVLAAIALLISQGFYGILRLSPLFGMIAQKDSAFIYSFKEWLSHPFQFLIGNLKGEFDWLTDYLTPYWVWLVALSWLINLPARRPAGREKALLSIWFAAPFVALAMLGRVLYPRFIFFMSLPLLVLVAYCLSWLITKLEKRRFLALIAFLLIFAYALYFDYFLLFNPVKAPMTKIDKTQYITSWPSGIGIKEAIEFFKKEATKQPITVATEGTFGMFPASLELYLWDNPNVTFKSYWPVREVPKEIIEPAGKKPVFFLFNETKVIPANWPLELVAQYPKIEKPYSLRIYRVLSTPEESR